MKIKYKILLSILFITSFLPAQSKENKDILVTIGSKIITADEFMRRAEYTIRPPYCKGDGGIEKKIILNSLITEKLLAIEAEKQDDNIYKKRFFNDFIKGRREQLMRQLLAFDEGISKAALDSAEIKKEFINSCKTYKAGFIITDDEQAAALYNRIKTGEPFEHVYHECMGTDSIQVKEIGWTTTGDNSLRDAVYSAPLKVNDIIAPVKISDTTSIILKINGWKEKVLITDKDIRERVEEVREKLITKKGDEIYSGYIASVMKGKNLELNKDTYPKLLKAVDDYYIMSAQDKQNAFIDLSFEKPGSSGIFTEDIEAIRNQPAFTFDGKTWTVSDLENEMKSHPLVFREKKFTKKEFPGLFKLAIADLLRDKVLTEIAYQKKYDLNAFVIEQTKMWEDASAALYEKYRLLENTDTTGSGWYETIEKHLNPVAESLLQKYSSVIEINTDLLNRIKLTKIDLITLETGVPYPVYVPSFPLLTTKNNINYGKKLQ